MTKTTNYQLNQWAKPDRVMMDDFNADNTKIDAALKANADAAAAASAAVALCGNCKIETSTYTGTGTGGASGPTTLIFPKRPALIAVMGDGFLMLLNNQISEGSATAMISYNGAAWGRVEISWQGNTLRYYNTDGYPGRQGNDKNVVYQVIAFYAQDK